MTPLAFFPRPALRDALARLTDGNLERREAALKLVEGIAKADITPLEVAAIISAASDDLPPRKFTFTTYDSALLQAVWTHCRDQHVPLIVERYGRLSSKGKAAALAALAQVNSRDATLEYVAILRKHGWPGESYPMMTLPFERTHEFGDILLPALADESIVGIPSELKYSVLLAYAQAGALPKSVATLTHARALQEAQQALDSVVPQQRGEGTSWRWAESYLETRGSAGLLLDVLAYLGKDTATVDVLRRGEALRDPRLRLFAILSLLRLGEAPDNPAVLAVASDPETRGDLFSALSSIGRRGLFPTSQSAQAQLAESDMVRWLTYPTELGCAPEHIELMKTVERDLGSTKGILVYYVFRFRTDPPHWAAKDGWLAGVSGPFRKEEFPTMDSWGDTFSSFTKWDDFTPDEHLSSISDLMARWRDHQGASSP
ncbi:MAG: hypothetical protein IT373_18735 [Polyangiaceae bacterium]|nr:hypothetical protein [Polyangiaceae bacterium]